MNKNNMIESVIINNFQTAQQNFPRLSKYLMSKLMDEDDVFSLPTCKLIMYMNIRHFLYYLCVIMEVKEDYLEALEYLQERLTNEKLINKNFLEFTDGFVYDYNFNSAYFKELICNASINFEAFFLESFEGSTKSPHNFDIFRNSVIKILNNQLKNCDINSKITTNEYTEICFMQALSNLLQKTADLDKIVNLST